MPLKCQVLLNETGKSSIICNLNIINDTRISLNYTTVSLNENIVTLVIQASLNATKCHKCNWGVIK